VSQKRRKDHCKDFTTGSNFAVPANEVTSMSIATLITTDSGLFLPVKFSQKF